jgi:integrase
MQEQSKRTDKRGARVRIERGIWKRDGRYIIGYTDAAGTWRMETTEATGVKQARELREAKNVATRKGDVAVPDRAILTEVAADFFETLDGLVASGDRSSRTRDVYEQRWRTHVEPHLGHMRIQSITPTHVARMLREVRATGLSNWTTLAILAVLGAIFEHARTRGIIHDSPLRRLGKTERPKAKNARKVRILTQDELASLISAATPNWTPFLTTVAFTGLRASEALGLRWQDVDTTEGVLHVRNQLGRNGGLLPLKTDGSERGIDMAPELRRVLLELRMSGELKSPTGFVFVTESGRTLLYANAKRAFNATAKRAGLADNGAERLSLHSLRHTFASALIAAGVDVVKVSKVLGHGRVSTTLDTYAAAFAARGADSMGDLIGAALSGSPV